MPGEEHEFVGAVRDAVAALKDLKIVMMRAGENLSSPEERLLVSLENALATYDAARARARYPDEPKMR